MAADGSFDPISPSLQAISSERPQNPLRLNSDEHLQVTGAPPPPLRSAYLPALPLTSGAGPTSRRRIRRLSDQLTFLPIPLPLVQQLLRKLMNPDWLPSAATHGEREGR
ncbi:hypothetical protein LINPERPRIM_LOCUS27586 [Linum perenne]